MKYNMNKIVFSLKDTTFQDLITLGRTYLLEGFIDGLKEEVVKGNSIIIERYEVLTNDTHKLEINTLEQLEEFKKSYLQI